MGWYGDIDDARIFFFLALSLACRTNNTDAYILAAGFVFFSTIVFHLSIYIDIYALYLIFNDIRQILFHRREM